MRTRRVNESRDEVFSTCATCLEDASVKLVWGDAWVIQARLATAEFLLFNWNHFGWELGIILVSGDKWELNSNSSISWLGWICIWFFPWAGNHFDKCRQIETNGQYLLTRFSYLSLKNYFVSLHAIGSDHLVLTLLYIFLLSFLSFTSSSSSSFDWLKKWLHMAIL